VEEGRERREGEGREKGGRKEQGWGGGGREWRMNRAVVNFP